MKLVRNASTLETALNNLVRAAREDSGLSQRALARRIGVTGSTVQKYEDGTLGLSLDTLRAISETTEKRIDWFLIEAGYLEKRDVLSGPTPRESLAILADLVDRAEKMERVMSFLNDLDRSEWPAGLAELVDGVDEKTGPSPGSAKKSGEVKRTIDGGFLTERDKRRREADQATEDEG